MFSFSNSKIDFFSLLFQFQINIFIFVNIFNREWLLTKIVNGERASYSAPKFARMQERTRSQMLEDIVANLANHAETGQIPKPYRRGSWRPIGEELCMLWVTYDSCVHSMYSLTLFLSLFVLAQQLTKRNTFLYLFTNLYFSSCKQQQNRIYK